MRQFNQILQSLRIERQWTQDQLAEALGITKQAVSHYERGTRYPKPELLEAISDLFNVDMDYLTGRSSETTRLLTDEELRVLNAYRAASNDKKESVCDILHIKRELDGGSSAASAM